MAILKAKDLKEILSKVDDDADVFIEAHRVEGEIYSKFNDMDRVQTIIQSVRYLEQANNLFLSDMDNDDVREEMRVRNDGYEYKYLS